MPLFITEEKYNLVSVTFSRAIKILSKISELGSDSISILIPQIFHTMNNHISFPHIKNASDDASTPQETANTMRPVFERGSNNVRTQGVHNGHALNVGAGSVRRIMRFGAVQKNKIFYL